MRETVVIVVSSENRVRNVVKLNPNVTSLNFAPDRINIAQKIITNKMEYTVRIEKGCVLMDIVKQRTITVNFYGDLALNHQKNA